MNFSNVISMASENKKGASNVKRYSTDVSAPKKLSKSSVSSSAVQSFLAKKAKDDKIKAIEAEKQRKMLLEMRDVARHNKKANAMAKRTKDNNFALGFTEPASEKLAELEKIRFEKERQEVMEQMRLNALRNQKQNDKSSMIREFNPKIAPTAIRNKQTIEARNTASMDQLKPTRTRNTGGPNSKSSSSNQSRPSGGGAAKGGAPTNYHDLLKFAYRKQFDSAENSKDEDDNEDDDDDNDFEEPPRPMSRKEKERFMEEKLRKVGKALPTLPPIKKKKSSKESSDYNNSDYETQANGSSSSRDVFSAADTRLNIANKSKSNGFKIPSKNNESFSKKSEMKSQQMPGGSSSNKKESMSNFRTGNKMSSNNVKIGNSNNKVIPRQNNVSNSRPGEPNSSNKLAGVSSKNDATKSNNSDQSIRQKQISNHAANSGHKQQQPLPNRAKLDSKQNPNRIANSSNSRNREYDNVAPATKNGKISSNIGEKRKSNPISGQQQRPMPDSMRMKSNNESVCRGAPSNKRTRVDDEMEFDRGRKVPRIENNNNYPDSKRTTNSKLQNSSVFSKTSDGAFSSHRNGSQRLPLPNSKVTNSDRNMGSVNSKPRPMASLSSQQKSSSQQLQRQQQPLKSNHLSQMSSKMSTNGSFKAPLASRSMNAQSSRPPISSKPRPPMRRESPPPPPPRERLMTRKEKEFLRRRQARERMLNSMHDPDEEQEDSEMDDFIDDDEIEEDDQNYSKHIKDIFGYDRKRYAYVDDLDDDDMETSYVEQMKEEARSARLGLLEDLEDIKREEEELNRELDKRNVKTKMKKKA